MNQQDLVVLEKFLADHEDKVAITDADRDAVLAIMIRSKLYSIADVADVKRAEKKSQRGT